MAPKKPLDPNELMIVNDSPGEECRIAILQDNHLEELFTERTATATNVGNIYKGRVTNVEPAIQAAFVDYGEGANGFLHISDLHPKYFPGEERTERVGKKIPRRERPPIQAALRRGQEILVQVLKEGIGTKGPTLTSYLSIPGRLLVLMPDMDRVGVSRKVEDEAKRREMRQILDSLELPDGFGFILRTAGYGKTKTELKRDAAYLMRMWKVMDKRISGVGAPCELYTESDLLLRTIRDVLRPSIKAIVVDSESAYERAAMFLRVVTPRSAPKVVRYRRPAPVFHAFDIERQIELIHSREVPLASGGRLVIDQTEALVAIDVNSGRSRSARDSETNAYETNVEATDEICRQLRLRDLGGLIVNDLIDMRSIKHRRLIEERFEINLKRDRAKATALPISDFGILEMTRQRMRPSIRKSHFMDCPHCNGHGEIKVPEYVAADAARHIGFLLQYERVTRVEVVCSPRVASVMLSGKRRELVRLEDSSGKRVDVRVSDAIAVDRVDYYAYDDRNADIDILKLPPLTLPVIEELEAEQLLAPVEEEIDVAEGPSGRRRRRRSGPADAAAMALAGGFDDDFDDLEDEEPLEAEPLVAGAEEGPPGRTAAGEPLRAAEHDEQGEPRRGRRRRRKRRGGRGGDKSRHQAHEAPAGSSVDNNGDPGQPDISAADADAWAVSEPSHDSSDQAAQSGTPEAQPNADGSSKRPRRRRGRRHRRGDKAAEQRDGQLQPADGAAASHPTSSQQPPTDASIDSPSSDGAPVRIHELARELSVTSRQVIDRCEPDPAIHHLANSLSTVSSDEAAAIRNMFADGVEGDVDQHSESRSSENSPNQATGNSPGNSQPPATGSGKRSRRRRDRKHRGAQGAGGGNGGGGGMTTTPAPAIMDASAQLLHSSTHDEGQGPGTAPGKNKRRPRRRKRGRKDGVEELSAAGGGRHHSNAANQKTFRDQDMTQRPQPAQPAPPAPPGPHLARGSKRQGGQRCGGQFRHPIWKEASPRALSCRSCAGIAGSP